MFKGMKIWKKMLKKREEKKIQQETNENESQISTNIHNLSIL